MTQCHIISLEQSKDKYEQTVMPQTRSKANRFDVNDDKDNDGSSTSGSSIVRDKIEVSS